MRHKKSLLRRGRRGFDVLSRFFRPGADGHVVLLLHRVVGRREGVPEIGAYDRKREGAFCLPPPPLLPFFSQFADSEYPILISH